MSAYKRIKLKNMGKWSFTALMKRLGSTVVNLVVIWCFCFLCMPAVPIYFDADGNDNDDDSSLTLSFRHISLLVAARGGVGY